MTQDHAAGRFLCEKNMSFTKLDSGIVNSSIWSEPVATRVLWITILSMSDETGFVSTSVPGLMRAANISKEEFGIGIKSLESPDVYSRTEAHEGRRIEKVEGGWIILNYMKYREREDRDAHREYMRKWRDKKNCELTVNHSESQNITVESPSASVSASASSSVLNTNTIEKFSVPTIEDITDYINSHGYVVDAQAFYAYYVSNGWKVGRNPMKSWKAAIVTWQKNNYGGKNG
jgi:hypothetical protein